MSNVDGLHDSLDSTFPGRMEDIQEENKCANRIADEVEKCVSLFEDHEVRVYNILRTFLESCLTEHKDSMAWFY